MATNTVAQIGDANPISAGIISNPAMSLAEAVRREMMNHGLTVRQEPLTPLDSENGAYFVTGHNRTEALTYTVHPWGVRAINPDSERARDSHLSPLIERIAQMIEERGYARPNNDHYDAFFWRQEMTTPN